MTFDPKNNSDEEITAELLRHQEKMLKESKLAPAEHELLAEITSAQIAGGLTPDLLTTLIAEAVVRDGLSKQQFDVVLDEVRKRFWAGLGDPTAMQEN
jgi:hypothetical protein